MNMRFKNSITLFSLLTVVMPIVAPGTTLLSGDVASDFEYDSIQGEAVKVFSKGLDKQLPADVAIQGIVQDYIMLFLAVPFLLIALYLYRRDSVKGKLPLTGTLLYFTVSYMIFLTMGMYSILFS